MGDVHIGKLDNTIIIGYRYFPIIQFFSLDDYSVKHWSLDFDKNDIPTRIDGDDNAEYGIIPNQVKRCFNKAYCSENRLYLLYDGNLYDPYNHKGNGSTIISFDSDHNVRQYNLPFPVGTIAIDEDDKWLYAHNTNGAKDVYWRFDLEL